MRRIHQILKIRRRRRRRKRLLRMALKLKVPKRATTTLKTIVRKQKVVALKRPPPFTLKISVNIAKTLMCTVYSTVIMTRPKCFWHDNYKICPICDH